MKISVERKIAENNDLVFTITCSEPHEGPFNHIDKILMTILDVSKKSVEEVPTGIEKEENRLKEDIIGLIHAAKEKAFIRVQKSLTFAIRNDLSPKWEHICQEIYNWIYDEQKEPLKRWMQEFDPQRTKYYFDNDSKIDSYSRKPIYSENVEVDDEDGDDE